MKNIQKMIYSDRSERIVFLALCATIFTYGFMFRIIDIRYTFWCALPFCIYYLFRNRTILLDISFWYLLIAMTMVGMIACCRDPGLSTIWSEAKLAWILPTIYLLGRGIAGYGGKNISYKAVFAITSLGSGMFLQGCLDYTNRFFKPFDSVVAWYGFWTNDWEVKNTYDVAWLIFISFFYYFIKRYKSDKKKCIAYMIVFMVVIVNILSVQGRTIPCLAVLLLLVHFFSDKIVSKDISKKSLRRFIVVALIIFAFILCVKVVLSVNIFGLGDIYRDSFLNRDGGIFNNIRFGLIRDSLHNSLTSPQGGWVGPYINGGTHCTWLEFSRVYNTYVFVILMVFVFASLYNGLLVLFNKKIGDNRFVIAGSLFAFFIFLTMEPLGYAPRYYIIFYVYIAGVVNGVKAICDVE